jgi:hypothetical protein
MARTECLPASVAPKRESQEGFTIKNGHWRAGLTSKLEPEFDLCRSIGDKYSWVMELDTTDVTTTTAPDLLLDDAQVQAKARSSQSCTECRDRRATYYA